MARFTSVLGDGARRKIYVWNRWRMNSFVNRTYQEEDEEEDEDEERRDDKEE